MFVRSFVASAITTSVMVFSSCSAKAEKSYHVAEPAARITAAQAVKDSKGGKVVFKCRKSKTGASGNAVAVKGSTPTWHSAIGKDEEAAVVAITDGKAIFACEGMSFDMTRKRMARAE